MSLRARIAGIGSGGSNARPHLDERSDDGADHVAQKPVAVDLDDEISPRSWMSRRSMRPHGVERARTARLKRREVVTADERRGGAPHRVDVRESGTCQANARSNGDITADRARR